LPAFKLIELSDMPSRTAPPPLPSACTPSPKLLSIRAID
jgi:hypothetical protein